MGDICEGDPACVMLVANACVASGPGGTVNTYTGLLTGCASCGEAMSLVSDCNPDWEFCLAGRVCNKNPEECVVAGAAVSWGEQSYACSQAGTITVSFPGTGASPTGPLPRRRACWSLIIETECNGVFSRTCHTYCNWQQGISMSPGLTMDTITGIVSGTIGLSECASQAVIRPILFSGVSDAWLDANEDGRANLLDLDFLASLIGSIESTVLKRYDIDGNGVIGSADIEFITSLLSCSGMDECVFRDTDHDGDVDCDDMRPAIAFDCVVGDSCYNPCIDSDLDGDLDAADYTAFITGFPTADVDDGSGTGTPDGGVTLDDLLYFIDAFENGDLAADIDDGSETGTPDGGVTLDDLIYFLKLFEGGC